MAWLAQGECVHGDRVYLRPPRWDEIAFIRRLWADRATMAAVGGPCDLGEDRARDWYSRMVDPGSPEHCYCLVFDSQGTPVGEVSFHGFDEHKQASLNIKILAAQRGRGYAEDALRAFMGYFFGTVGGRMLVDEVAGDNLPGQQLLRKMGFMQDERAGHVCRLYMTQQQYRQDANPIVVEYDPAWPEAFDALAAVLAEAMGLLARAIHHVGSTAIPGMAAKPVLDIDIELVAGASVAAASEALATLGYEYQGDKGIKDRYAYRRLSAAVPLSARRQAWPSHHLYVCPHGSAELARHLLFRDRLRADPALLREYLELKQDALRRANGVRQVYVDEKARLGEAFFRKVLGA